MCVSRVTVSLTNIYSLFVQLHSFATICVCVCVCVRVAVCGSWICPTPDMKCLKSFCIFCFDYVIAFRFQNSHVRGYHDYMDIWTPIPRKYLNFLANTHFIFYKNIVYKNHKVQIYQNLRKI